MQTLPQTDPSLFKNQHSIEKIDQKSKERDSHIKVFIRKRPLLKSEFAKTDIITIQNQTSLVINDGTNIITSTFDCVFSEKSNQMQVFENLKPYLETAFQGFNLSIFSYGQTGAGKTYTMFGADWDILLTKRPQIPSKEQHTFFQDIETDFHFAGVIPRAITEIFSIMKNKDYENKFNIFCTFSQIYNEKIFDLLQNQSEIKALNIRENILEGIFVEGLAEYSVSTAEECLILMRRGEKNRITRSTLRNTKSSRSHTIFQILIESSKADKNGKLQKAKINLCDLAGSEKINKDEQMEAGHLSELKKINLSLTTLGQIIHILSNQSKLPLPFRESKLTRLLQDSFGGNTQTFIIANVAPLMDCIDETVNTLKFAERAKNVMIKVKVNEISATDDALINKLQKEINYLKNILKMKRKNGLAGGVQDIHTKLIHLQQENDRLRQNFVSINEVEKLISENKSMKLELQKLHTISYDNEFMGTTNGLYSLKEIPPRQETLNDEYDGLFKNLKTRMISNETRESFPHTVNPKKYSYNSENLSYKIKNSDSSKSIRSNFLLAGKMVFNDKNRATDLKTEAIIRTRGKNNNVETHKGFMEMTMEEHQREEEKFKDKLRTIERLKDLERIQKYNEEKLKEELEKLEKNKATGSKNNIFNGISVNYAKNANALKQSRKSEEYNQKIKLFEKNFFKL